MGKVARRMSPNDRSSAPKKPSGNPRASPKKGTLKKRHHGKGFNGKEALSLFLYGPPGVGKTSVLAHFPNVGFLIDSQELGIRTLTEYDLCPEPVIIEEADAFPQVLKFLYRVAQGEVPIDTLIIESMTGIETLCFQHHCHMFFEDDWSKSGFYSFQQGPENAAKTDWPQFIDALEAVRQQGINTVVTAHSVIRPYKNPQGPDWDQYMPAMNKHTWLQLKRYVKAVLFYNYSVSVDKKGLRQKAMGDDERYIYTQWAGAYEAKNQYGLEPAIEAGHDGKSSYDALINAFNPKPKRR